MAIKFVLLLGGAYLLGSVPTAYLIARWLRGIDIRRYGSGNVGAANVFRVASKWSSLPVFVFDLVKGMLPVYLAQLIDLPVYQQVIIGLAAIVGHNWSVFLGFSGGRGALTTLGVILRLSPWLALLVLIIALVWFPFRQLPLGVLLALSLAPVFSWFINQPLGIERSLWLTLGFVAILLLTVIRRLITARTLLSASVSQGELVVNRLLFDRDIRDRKAWVSQTPLEAMAESLLPEEKPPKTSS